MKYFILKGADVHYVHNEKENVVSYGLHCSTIREKNLGYLVDLGVDVKLNSEVLFRLSGMGSSTSLTFDLGFNYEPKLFDTNLLPLMKKFLENGADPNAIYYKETPLIFLADVLGLLGAHSRPFPRSDRSKESTRYIPIVKLLLQFGADKSLGNEKGATAHDQYLFRCNHSYSKTKCDPEIVELLKP